MSARAVFRPKRRLRYEVYTLSAVLAVPVALALAFPYDTVSFTAAPDVPRPGAFCAFVSLSEEEEDLAMTASRTAWKVSAEDVRSLRPDLSMDSAPEEPIGSVTSLSGRTPLAPPTTLGACAPALPPTRAASEPFRIVGEPPPDEDETLAFPRKEMLQID